MTDTIRGTTDIATLNNLVGAISGVQRAMTTTTGEPYLRMGKDGVWIYGPENLEVKRGSEWAIHPLTVQHGYVCWEKNPDPTKTNSKLGEVMVPAGQARPPITSLTDYGYPWSEQVSFVLVGLDGDDKGVQVKYSAASVGGMSEIKKLLGVLAQKIASEQQRGGGSLSEDTSEIVPVVNLDHSFYTHKKHGKIYTPVLPVVRWGTLNNQDRPAGGARKGPVNVAEPKPETQAATASDIPFEGGAPRTRRRA
jgi:hypothetical protein